MQQDSYNSVKKMRQAVQLIKTDQREAAIPILKEILQKERDNEYAWLSLSMCLDDVEQKKYCLGKVLKNNPGNEHARHELAKLNTPNSPLPPLKELGNRPPQEVKTQATQSSPIQPRTARLDLQPVPSPVSVATPETYHHALKQDDSEGSSQTRQEIRNIIKAFSSRNLDELAEDPDVFSFIKQGSPILAELARYKMRKSEDSRSRQVADELLCLMLGVPSKMIITKVENLKLPQKAIWFGLAGFVIGLFISISVGSLYPLILLAYLGWSLPWTFSNDLLVGGWFFPRILRPVIALFIAIEHSANLRALQKKYAVYEENFKSLLSVPVEPALNLSQLEISQKIILTAGINPFLAIFLALVKVASFILSILAIIGFILSLAS